MESKPKVQQIEIVSLTTAKTVDEDAVLMIGFRHSGDLKCKTVVITKEQAERVCLDLNLIFASENPSWK